MDNDSLALELLHEIKKTSKRWFILFIITLMLLFISNIIWLYAWCLPTEQTTTSYDVQSDNGSNAIYNGDGEVNINGGESKSY